MRKEMHDFMKKRITAFFLMLCMAFTSVPAFALDEVTTGESEGSEAPVVIAPTITMQGDTKAYVGRTMNMKATVTGLSSAVTGVTVTWKVNGKTVKSESAQTIQNGTQLALSYVLPTTTTAASNTVAVNLTQGTAALGSKSTKVTTLFGFNGATITPDKTTYATVGRSKTVSMKLTGLKSKFEGVYLWYVNGKAKTKKTTTFTNNQTIKFTYKPSKSGTDKIQLVLKSADGKVSMKSSVKNLKIYSKYAKTLSSYTTYFTTSNYNRCVNMRNVIRAINGKIIQPGKTFSLNNATGKRNAANGYRRSIIFSGSSQRYGYGGGTCQVVSTLFNTVLLANMTISERHNHSQAVSYIPKGRDAAVGSSLDFRFKNNLSVPVKIVATYNSRGSITIKLKADYGTQTKPVKLKVTRSNGYYVLRRYANNKLNYTTRSKH